MILKEALRWDEYGFSGRCIRGNRMEGCCLMKRLLAGLTALMLLLTLLPGAGAEAVLYSTNDAYRKQSVQYATAQREDGDETGRAVLAALCSRTLSDGRQATVFAAGSRMLYADDLMGATTYANSLFLFQVIGYLCGDRATLSIPPKTMSVSPLPITHAQATAWGAMLIIAVPLAVLAAGLRTTCRRRRL